MQECNPRKTPLPYKRPFDDSLRGKRLPPQEASEFLQTIGDLRYISDSTRRDIHSAVSKLAGVMPKPTAVHQKNLNWLLRYQKGTRTHAITYGHAHNHNDSALCTYSDSYYANDPDIRSRTGRVRILYKAPIVGHHHDSQQ